MNLTAEQLKNVEELAYRAIPPFLVAINLGIDEFEFCEAVRTSATEERTAYYRGYLRQVIETREFIIRSAKNGSNPAQLELLSFLREAHQHLRHE